MKQALLSVSDKTNIDIFAQSLINLGFKILSTGGTLEFLRKKNIEALDVSSYTNSPEMFNGRVKTLHPKIHGGILFKRDSQNDVKQAKENDIKEIDLVCVNLYPFKSTSQKTQDLNELIEQIDIGGPAMIRSAAKNHASCLVLTSPDDYERVILAIKNKKDNLEFRQSLMVKAFEHTASYDAFIANYFNARLNLNRKIFIEGSNFATLKYGENPHQKGALYEFDNFYSKYFKALKSTPSFNNITDLSGAVKLASLNKNSVAIVKHSNPCGFSINDDILQAWDDALICDKLSSFGGVVAINANVSKELALKINEIFIECLVAPSFDDDALKVFENKKRIKIFSLNNDNFLPKDEEIIDFKHVLGGFVLQSADKILEHEILDAKLVTTTPLSKNLSQDLSLAWSISALTKSNSISFVKNKTLLAIGMGMTSRVDATNCAIKKASSNGIDLSGSCVASEAFFPFRDSVDLLSSVKIAAVAQPGGSIRDKEVINAANEHNIAMIFTDKRHFLH